MVYEFNDNNFFFFFLGANIVDVLEFYFQCCSMTITTNYMSIVAATLANGGVCPITGEQVFSAGWFILFYFFVYTLFSFYKNNFIRTSRLKFGLKIFQKLWRT